MWQGWLDLAAGAWLIICTFIPSLHTPISMIVGGAVVTIFGFWGARSKDNWEGIVNGIIGIWLLLSGIWLSLAVSWNFFIAGVIIAVFAIGNVSRRPISKGPAQQTR